MKKFLKLAKLILQGSVALALVIGLNTGAFSNWIRSDNFSRKQITSISIVSYDELSSPEKTEKTEKIKMPNKRFPLALIMDRLVTNSTKKVINTRNVNADIKINTSNEEPASLSVPQLGTEAFTNSRKGPSSEHVGDKADIVAELSTSTELASVENFAEKKLTTSSTTLATSGFFLPITNKIVSDPSPATVVGTSTLEIDTTLQEVSPEEKKVPQITLTIKDKMVENGGRTTIYWNAINADKCFATEDWYGGKPVSGESVIEEILANSTFVLTCSNEEHKASASVYLEVDASPWSHSSVVSSLKIVKELFSGVNSPTLNNSISKESYTGTSSFSISGVKGVTPRFVSVDITPIDVKVGDTQTLRVKILSENPLKTVEAITTLDTQTIVLSLDKVSEDSTGEIYETSWQVFDTHVRDYLTNFVATDKMGHTNSVKMAWIDPCENINDGLDSILGNDCTVSIVDGIDGGNLIIPANTTLILNSGSLFAWNPGKSMTIQGTIAIAKGATLQKGYLYYEDTDGDGYIGKLTKVFSKESVKSGFVRSKDKKTKNKDATNTNDLDADDTNSSCQSLRYYDGDGDGYGTGELVCVDDSNPNYIDNNDDCDDTDPGLTLLDKKGRCKSIK